MIIKRIFLNAAIVYATIMGASAQSTNPQPPKPDFWYWDNWTDNAGLSHMTRCPVTSFDLKSMSPPADPQFQAKQPQGSAQVILTEQPAGWKGAWHEDPKPQWMIPLKGTWFVQAMDGQRVNLGPGDVSLGEDQNTKPDVKGAQRTPVRQRHSRPRLPHGHPARRDRNNQSTLPLQMSRTS